MPEIDQEPANEIAKAILLIFIVTLQGENLNLFLNMEYNDNYSYLDLQVKRLLIIQKMGNMLKNNSSYFSYLWRMQEIERLNEFFLMLGGCQLQGASNHNGSIKVFRACLMAPATLAK